MEAWFGRMLHAAATLTLVGEFRPFRELAATTLGSVLEQLGGNVGRADEVLQGLGELEPYPDAAEAIRRLEDAGVRIATLTNGGEHTRRLLARGVSGAQIHPSRCDGVFVDQSAEPVAALEPIVRVRTGKA